MANDTESLANGQSQCVGDTLWCTKKRYKNGNLEVLFTNRIEGEIPKGSLEFSEWYDVGLFPCLQHEFCDPQSRTTGSKIKFINRLDF